MPDFGKRVDGPGGRRRAVREQVLLAASAITLENSQSVVVEDICARGAKLCGRNLPPVGADMLVKAGAVEVMAAVAWHERDWCGITFETPLDSEGVRLLKQEGRLASLMGINTTPISTAGRVRQPSYRLAY